MRKSKHLILALFVAALHTLVNAQGLNSIASLSTAVPGNMQTQKYLPLLANKRVAIVTNASGMIGSTSLVDSLLSLKVKVKKVFVPEHGFRGEVDAGEKVTSTKDKKTGLPIVSLYGKNKKPQPAQLADVDIVVYDIQDIGVRFYTYISTLSYVMEACAEQKKPLIVLDRPNPNGFYVDGPVLKPQWKSFLGLHPVPIVYGMTCGEYAKMVNEEGWLAKGKKCELTVITMEAYDRNLTYHLPVKPSPNIGTDIAVILYPSLGLFEGTIMSLGRGTEFPFMVVGHPEYPQTAFSFTPQPTSISQNPRYSGKTCYGMDLRAVQYPYAHPRRLNLSWLLDVYLQMGDSAFFERNFNYHAGNNELQQQIKKGMGEEEIRNTWREDLAAFGQIRKKYLLYPDFIEMH